MTIEDGSSLSQSETHLEVFENLVDADRDMLRDIINEQLIPRMIRHGFPLQGIHFEWDDSIDYTPEQQKAFEEMLLNHYEIEGNYFIEKYGVPIGERKRQPIYDINGNIDNIDNNDPTKKRTSGNNATTKNDGSQLSAQPFFD